MSPAQFSALRAMPLNQHKASSKPSNSRSTAESSPQCSASKASLHNVPSFTVTPPSLVTTPTEVHGNLASHIDAKIQVRSSQTEIRLSLSRENIDLTSDLLSPLPKEISVIEMPYPPYRTNYDEAFLPLLYIHSEDEFTELKHQDVRSIFCNAIEEPKAEPHAIGGINNSSAPLERSPKVFFSLSSESPPRSFTSSSVNTNIVHTLNSRGVSRESISGKDPGESSDSAEKNISATPSLVARFRGKLKLKMPNPQSNDYVDEERRGSLLSVSFPIGTNYRRPSMTSLLSLTPSLQFGSRRFSFLGSSQPKVSYL